MEGSARVLKAILWFTFGAISIVCLVFLAFETGHLSVFPTAPPVHQIELISLFLGAATLVVTALGVVVALGAVIGYTALKEEIATSSERAAREAGDKVVREVVGPVVRRMEAMQLDFGVAGGPEDRTREIAAALSERGDDAEPTQN